MRGDEAYEDTTSGIAAAPKAIASLPDGTPEETARLLLEAQALGQVGTFRIGCGLDDRVSCSYACSMLFGFAGEVPATTAELLEHVDASEGAAFVAAIEDAARGESRELELSVVRSDASQRFVRVRVFPGERGVLGVVRDETDSRHYNERLRATEWRYSRLLESTSEGVCVIDSNGRTLFVNARMATMFGYSRDELIGRDALSLMTEETRIFAEQKLAARRRGLSETYEYSYRRKDGGTLWALVKSNPLLDEHGRYDGALILMTDISERRRFDEDRNRLAAIVESCQDAIISTDLGGIIESWNRGAEQLYGYCAEESVGRSIAVLVPEDRAGEERVLLAQVARGNVVAQFETTRRRKDGLLVDVSIVFSPIRDAQGRIVGASKISRNLTEQRRTEAQLRQTEQQLRHAQKLEALGSLAGGVAHDFNNVLSVIRAYVAMALKETAAGSALKLDLEQVARAAERGAELAKQLLAFSRRQVLEPTRVDLNAAVRGVTTMLERVLGNDINLSLVLEPELGAVFTDSGQLEQVIVNLIVNARDAMPEGGELVVETRNVSLRENEAGPSVEAGDYVALIVRDTGTGIDPAVLPRVFEPFFTTKAQGDGTGLGLSTVYGIVTQSGGHVSVESKVDCGSTFRVLFPRR